MGERCFLQDSLSSLSFGFTHQPMKDFVRLVGNPKKRGKGERSLKERPCGCYGGQRGPTEFCLGSGSPLGILSNPTAVGNSHRVPR